MRWSSILNLFGLFSVGTALVLSGCSEIAEMKRNRLLLDDFAKTNAPESLVWKKMPMKWSVYEPGTSEGEEFGRSLLRNEASDLKEAKENWRSCDRALWHTTESAVTIVFVKTNVVFGYYIGSQ
jgi:hypothetical protein